MGNIEDYEAKIAEISKVRNEDIIAQTHIPADTYIQEAENLFKLCQADKVVLVASGIDWKIVLEIPVLAGAAREAVCRWVTQRYARMENGKLWKRKSVELIALRNLLLHGFRFAYRNNPQVSGRIHAIDGGKSYAALIQDLNDLSVLGKSNPSELLAIKFDMTLLNTAATQSCECAVLYAASTVEAMYNEARLTRDRALTLLKIAVDEVYGFGQYVFWNDREKKRGYSSPYLRRLRKKWSKNVTTSADSGKVS
jgi:hypothetical protein